MKKFFIPKLIPLYRHSFKPGCFNDIIGTENHAVLTCCGQVLTDETVTESSPNQCHIIAQHRIASIKEGVLLYMNLLQSVSDFLGKEFSVSDTHITIQGQAVHDYQISIRDNHILFRISFDLDTIKETREAQIFGIDVQEFCVESMNAYMARLDIVTSLEKRLIEANKSS